VQRCCVVFAPWVKCQQYAVLPALRVSPTPFPLPLTPQNWREYEHLHTLLWLCKDLSWDLASPLSWVVFIIPTFLIALDFIWMTWSTHVRDTIPLLTLYFLCI
jgi:hypothetical protein